MIEYYQKNRNISKTCRYFGISRTTFYKWYERYKKEGIEALYDRPKTPKNKRKPEFFIEAKEYFGFDIKGIQHYFSYLNSPKTNLNVERLIRSIEEELRLIEGTEYTIDELNKKLRRYLRIYNFIRPHYALGLRTPADKSLIWACRRHSNWLMESVKIFIGRCSLCAEPIRSP